MPLESGYTNQETIHIKKMKNKSSRIQSLWSGKKLQKKLPKKPEKRKRKTTDNRKRLTTCYNYDESFWSVGIEKTQKPKNQNQNLNQPKILRLKSLKQQEKSRVLKI